MRKRRINKKIAGKKNAGSDRDALIKVILAIVAIIILIFLILYGNRLVGGEDGSAVAEVNGQKITPEELDYEYNIMVTPDYKSTITKESFLNQTLIPQTLLFQEADKQKIKAGKEETNAFMQDFISQSGMTKEDIEKQLEGMGMTYKGFEEYYSKRLRLVKLLNATLGIPQVAEEEIRQFYDENKQSLSAGGEQAAYDDVKQQLEAYLMNQKQEQSIKEYIAGLRGKAEIKIYSGNIKEQKPAGSTFSEANSTACYEEGKSVIRMYSTTACPHCRWIKNTFDSVAKEYIDQGRIKAYHWEIDTGDNTLTDETETSMPQKETDLLRQYNSMGGVPFYVFGCRYLRIGNAFESENDLNAERMEFEAVINLLVSSV